MPGSYLAKVGLPAFVVAVALATSYGNNIARAGAVVALLSIVLSVLTGERINFFDQGLLRDDCRGGLETQAMARPVDCMAVELIAVVVVMNTRPDLGNRYVDNFIDNLPTHAESPYYRAMAPGVIAFDQEPVFGIGPGNLRHLCNELIAESTTADCHPHPHNYYIQMAGETGILGLVTESCFLDQLSGSAPCRQSATGIMLSLRRCGSCLLACSGQLRRLPTSSASGTTFLCGAL